MVFFKNFQQNLFLVFFLVDIISNVVEDLIIVVGEVSYVLIDLVVEQVISMINGFCLEEESFVVVEVGEMFKLENVMLLEVFKNFNCQKT